MSFAKTPERGAAAEHGPRIAFRDADSHRPAGHAQIGPPVEPPAGPAVGGGEAQVPRQRFHLGQSGRPFGGAVIIARRQLLARQQACLEEADEGAPVAAPDSNWIFFVSNRTGEAHVWRMNADGSNQIQLTQKTGGFPVSVSSDGKWVVFGSFKSGVPRLWKVSIDGGDPERSPHDIGRRHLPAHARHRGESRGDVGADICGSSQDVSAGVAKRAAAA